MEGDARGRQLESEEVGRHRHRKCDGGLPHVGVQVAAAVAVVVHAVGKVVVGEWWKRGDGAGGVGRCVEHHPLEAALVGDGGRGGLAGGVLAVVGGHGAAAVPAPRVDDHVCLHVGVVKDLLVVGDDDRLADLLGYHRVLRLDVQLWLRVVRVVVGVLVVQVRLVVAVQVIGSDFAARLDVIELDGGGRKPPDLFLERPSGGILG